MRVWNLRVDPSNSPRCSPFSASLCAKLQVEALRTSQRELESRLAPLLLRQQALAHDEEASLNAHRLESLGSFSCFSCLFTPSGIFLFGFTVCACYVLTY